MGRGKRVIPRRMPEKLGAVRNSLGLSFEGMRRQLEIVLQELNYSEVKLHQNHIGEFEKGLREPSLPVLLAYAVIVNDSIDVLVNEKKELPLRFQKQ